MHLLECCLVTDGGGALVVTSADRARSCRDPAARVRARDRRGGRDPARLPDGGLHAVRGVPRASAAAFTEAGVGVGDVDHLMVYDAFAHLPLYGLEDLGFVGRGEAGGLRGRGGTPCRAGASR